MDVVTTAVTLYRTMNIQIDCRAAICPGPVIAVSMGSGDISIPWRRAR